MRETKFNLLEIDLTTGEKKVVDLTKDVKKYIGGRGLGAKILWDRMKPGTAPFSPDNIIMFFTGPLTGMFAGNRVIVRFKSPLTATSTGLNLMGHAAMGGNWAAELKNAGFDGIIITGRDKRFFKEPAVHFGRKKNWKRNSAGREYWIRQL